ETFQNVSRPRANMPGELASLDAMATRVHLLWPDQDIRSLTVYHPGDAGAYVQINTSAPGRVRQSVGAMFFDGKTGELLLQRAELKPMMNAFQFILGVHLIQFHHWTLRCLYFALGIAGCVLIGTGFLWLESRRKRHASLGLSGVRIVEALA